jgi:predicted metal-dependent hydrolase
MRPRPTPPPRALVVAGERVEVRVRRSGRARRLRLLVGDAGVELVAPAGASERAIDAAVADGAAWVGRTIARRARRAAAAPPLSLGAPGVVWRHGQPLPAAWHPGRRAGVRLEGGRLVVAAPDPASARRAVERWYRRVARSAVGARVAAFAPLLAVAPARVAIGDARTRWGSCSTTGTLSFTWRLQLAPAWVLDAIVWHELCHLRHHDHSPAFWRLLDRVSPDRRAAKAWLDAHRAELRAYVPRP